MPEGFFLFLIFTFHVLAHRTLYLVLFPPEVVLYQANLIQVQSVASLAIVH
jgi:hypothetical protein